MLLGGAAEGGAVGGLELEFDFFAELLVGFWGGLEGLYVFGCEIDCSRAVSGWLVIEGERIQLSSPWPRSSTFARAKVVAIHVLPRT